MSAYNVDDNSSAQRIYEMIPVCNHSTIRVPMKRS